MKMTDFYQNPPFYRDYIRKLFSLQCRYPFLKLEAIGKSVLNRNIFSLWLGNRDNKNLLAGAFHAQEWLTTTLLLKFIEELCYSLKSKQGYQTSGLCVSAGELRNAILQKGLCIVPMVNPDGVSIALEGAKSAGELSAFVERTMLQSDKTWQANARGVDLNHNFNAGYKELKKLERQAGITKPSPRQYGGLCPHSEPETRAMAKLLTGGFSAVYAFHSQGEEIFYEYGDCQSICGQYIAKLMSDASGYSLVKNDGLCSHGGFKDYFIATYSRPGYTIEIGRGENPLPITDITSVYERLRELLLIATVM